MAEGGYGYGFEPENAPAGAAAPIDIDPFNLNYLKLMLKAINEDYPSFGLSRPLTVKALESLDAQTFKSILVYLITTAGIYPESRFAEKRDILTGLADRVDFMPILEYDGAVDNLYWSVKDLFPDNDDVFTYELMYFPEKDGMAVKSVLNYLTSLAVFCDHCSEAFIRIHDEVFVEHESRVKLKGELQDIKARIAEKILQHQNKREIAPSLQLKLRDRNALLLKKTEEVIHLERTVMDLRKKYDAEDAERIRAETKLERATKLRKELEAKVVRNPELLLKEEQDEKDKIVKLLAEREELGRKIDDIGKLEAFTQDVIEKSTKAIAELHECITEMEEIEREHEVLTELRNEIEEKARIFRGLREDLALAKSKKEKLKKKIEERQALKALKKELRLRKLKQAKEKVIVLMQENKRKQAQKQKLVKYIEIVENCNKETQERIVNCIEFIQITGPEMMNYVYERTAQVLSGFIEAISVDEDVLF